MSVNLFDVDPAMIRDDYYPMLGEFASDSQPTADTIERWVSQEAATLEGKLRKESLTGESYTDDESAPWLWCQKTLSLMVALRPGWPQAAVTPENTLKRWKEDLDARMKDLDENGAVALGESAATETPNGATSHISQYDLSVGDIGDASDATPPFRKSDQL